MGLGCRRGWVGIVIPGVLTRIGLALHHPPNVATAHWSGVPAPRIPVCSGGWCAPKWSQSYSWRIHTSLIRVASTWWPGEWLTYSRLRSPPPIKIGFWLFPTYGHVWYLVRIFGFTHIASMFIKNEGGVLSYINKVKSRHGIELPKTCGFHNYSVKQVLMLDLCLINLIFHYQ